jgi:BCD family chlorophyll transporter-like MFS transporter
MSWLSAKTRSFMVGMGPRIVRFLPFADAATADLPLGRLLRLSLFQLTGGMAFVLLNGTLNRVMIVEMSVPASLVAVMVALPLLFAPLRALVGFRSDTHRSAIGWRRVPYIWMGSLVQFGGLAIMPFALLVLSGDGEGPIWVGQLGAALAFLLVGAGMLTAQTAGLALATDLASESSRPRVVALMYVTLLVGSVASGFVFGELLADFSAKRLVQVVQGAAVVTLVLNMVALWKQEVRNPGLTSKRVRQPTFAEEWRALAKAGRTLRLLVAVGLGTAAFAMQDILLEPYGGQVLKMSVGATTELTATLAFGALLAFALAANLLERGFDPHRLAAHGALLGIVAFALVVFSAPLDAVDMFRVGVFAIGAGGGMFSVGTLTAVMSIKSEGRTGLALGAWGAVQATASGTAVALGGLIGDGVGALAKAGVLGVGLSDPAVGYSVVYHIEIALLFATLVAIGPLVRVGRARPAGAAKFGLAEMPG